MKHTGASALQFALSQICDGIQVESRGVFIPDSIQFEQAEEISGILFDLEEVNRFVVGDFLNHCERVFREGWTQLLSEKLAKRSTTIENWRYVCRNVPYEVRRADLGMTAHYGVASLKSHLLQEQILRFASEYDFSSEEVKQWASLFGNMSFEMQTDWGQRIVRDGFGPGELVAAYREEYPELEQATESQPAPLPAASSVTASSDQSFGGSDSGEVPFRFSREEQEETEYSGEAGDYDWSEKDDYDPDDEEPGDLVALKTALDELYLATDLETYAKRRITFTRLLAELDQERSEIFAAEGSEVEYA